MVVFSWCWCVESNTMSQLPPKKPHLPLSADIKGKKIKFIVCVFVCAILHAFVNTCVYSFSEFGDTLVQRSVDPKLANILLTVCPYMKLDHASFSLRELIQLFELYMEKNAITKPPTEEMKANDQQTGNISSMYELDEKDPLQCLIQQKFPGNGPLNVFEFLLTFCGPPTQDFVVI